MLFNDIVDVKNLEVLTMLPNVNNQRDNQSVTLQKKNTAEKHI